MALLGTSVRHDRSTPSADEQDRAGIRRRTVIGRIPFAGVSEGEKLGLRMRFGLRKIRPKVDRAAKLREIRHRRMLSCGRPESPP